MKKKSGFTLIELLAVIVILAIIALIATPMVLKYIQNAKEQSGEQSIKAMVKAAETYRMANYDSTDFPMTIYFPDPDNTLNLKNIDRANGYLNINDKGDSELLITIDNITYAKNYGDDKIYNLNKDNYIYDGSSEEWIVSKNNPEKLITWNPIGGFGIETTVGDYINLSYFYYCESVSSYPSNFQQTIDKKESLDASLKEFEVKNKGFMRFIPTVLKDEVDILNSKLKDKYGQSITDTTLISYEEIDGFFEQIQADIPIIYEWIYGTGDFNFRLDNNSKIDVTTVIPGKVNGNEITTIEKYNTVEDCESMAECINLYAGGSNYYYNLIISEGIETIGDGYFRNRQVYSLKLPTTIKEIGSNSFHYNKIAGSLAIPDSVTSLGNFAFANNQINSVNIPKGLTIIPSFAFAYNKINGKLVIPDNITQINTGAFRDNEITELVIPASVTTIQRVAFTNNSIKKITIEGDKTRFNDIWTTIGLPAELMPS
ncbi:MAG: leucine-rich repeat domain-containing protein [Bacilli bacterium]